MKQTTASILGYLKHLDKKRDEFLVEVNAIDEKIEQYKQLLLETCDHSKSYTDTEYEPGSYYDRQKWYKTERCSICNKQLAPTETITGGYG